MDNTKHASKRVSSILKKNKIESSSASEGDISNDIQSASKDIEEKSMMESEEEREKGWSDMTETEASESDEDDSKLVIDVSSRVTSKLTSKDLDSTRVRSLEETRKFLEGNTSLAQEDTQDDGDTMDCEIDDSDDEEIVFSSSGAPDKFGFLTEIYIPKMRGFEDLSDRCILDSVSVNLTLDQVVRSSMDQFNSIMRSTELTDTQREITKYVRRRARNRVSARKSRMKKISDIVRLSSEIKVIQQKKISLKLERGIMEKLKVSWKNRVKVLKDYILEYLREHGEGNDISLHFRNGSVVLEGGREREDIDLSIVKEEIDLDIVKEEPDLVTSEMIDEN